MTSMDDHWPTAVNQFQPTITEYPKPVRKSKKEAEQENKLPLWVVLTTLLSYTIVFAFGHLRDFFGRRFKSEQYAFLTERQGYAPLVADFESFFSRRLYRRIRNCWNRPVTGVPGRTIGVLDRVSKDYNVSFQLTGKVIDCINMSSYNYLGFAQSQGACATEANNALTKYGLTMGSTRSGAGTNELHLQLEKLVAEFVGKPAAIVTAMGFATNSTTLPALIGKGGLIISDENNHASLITGFRNSPARVRVFKHNDLKDLEVALRDAIAQGQPRTHRPWTNIMVVVEGLYSMEGDVVDLPKLLELKKKYKFVLYMDEAHSIGALGPNGRGVCDYWGVDPKEVDILMGTFTKSFGSAGGYIAGSQDLIEHLRGNAHGFMYGEAMSPAVCQQVITSMNIIMGRDGTDEGKRRILQLAENSMYLRSELKKLGLMVLGAPASPVVPVIVGPSGKLVPCSNSFLKRRIAVVVVGYPATPLVTSRVRFCVSAAHVREDLDAVVNAMREVSVEVRIRHHDYLVSKLTIPEA